MYDYGAMFMTIEPPWLLQTFHSSKCSVILIEKKNATIGCFVDILLLYQMGLYILKSPLFGVYNPNNSEEEL